jgi:hypothetical protein
VNSATISGDITDSSNLAIPGAQVTVTNEATAIRRVVKSNDVGIYVVAGLPIGPYRIEVEAAGFKKALREGIQCDVGQVIPVNFTLEVGLVTESITVREAAPTVATETTSLGNLRYGQQIQAMPLNARNLSALYALTAGVPVYSNGVNPAATGFVDNNGVGDTGFSIDGTVGNSPINGNSGNVPSLNGRVIEQNMPNLESVAEFRFETSNGKAEFGQISTISIVSRSGTNTLHGSAFEYNRVGATSARSFFVPQRENLTRNQYGLSLGGPVYIPGAYNGRNRTFFFGAWEGFRDNRGFAVTGEFPNSAQKNGDLSVLNPRIALLDPNGGLFPNDVIPPSRIVSVSRSMLAYVPPVPGDVSPTTVGYNFAGAKPEVDMTDKFDVKMDHRFSNRDSISGRFTYSDNFNDWTNVSPLPNQIGLGLQDTLGRQFSVVETHIFSPATLNEARLGYWRKRRFVRVGLSDVNFLTGENAIPGITPAPPFQGLPLLTFNNSLLGVTPTLFGSSTTDRKAAENTFQFSDNLTLVHSRHTFKFGGDIRRPSINNYSVANPAGLFTFSSSSSVANSATGDSFADFLLGLPQTSAWAVAKDAYTRGWQYFFYGQDDFKVSSRLMINYGLRWDYYGKLSELYGRDANYDFALRKVVTPSAGQKYFLPGFVGNPLIVTAESVGLGNPPIIQDRNNFAPRVGVAWQPFGMGKTVIRAAYGIFYASPSGFLNFQDATLPPYNQSYSYSRPTAIGADGTPPSFSNPVATGGAATANLLAPVNSVDRNYRDLYAQVWNFSIEQGLRRNFVARTSYVGNRGNRLYRQVYANACLPGPVACDARTASQNPRYDVNFPDTAGGIRTVGRSIYNALQVEGEKRYSNGLFFNGNYTFGRLIGLSVVPENPIANASLDRGRDPSSITSAFHFNAVWDLPFGPHRYFLRDLRGPTAKILGGWQLAGIAQIQSGMPFTVTAPAGNTGTGSSANRANRTADGRLPTNRSEAQMLSQYFDVTAFSVPPIGTVGTSGVGVLIGPGLFNSDISLMKNTLLREPLNLQFRADFFNIFNHPNFDLPNADSSSPAFGKISGTNPYTFPRQIQFGLRLQF